MEYSYKFRIYPNAEQEKLIHRTFGCCRYVYNHYLSKRMELYKENGSTMNYPTDRSMVHHECHCLKSWITKCANKVFS